MKYSSGSTPSLRANSYILMNRVVKSKYAVENRVAFILNSVAHVLEQH